MCFFQNPEIIFITFFVFLLCLFSALIPQKCIGCMHLVLITSPTVLADPFENLQALLEWSENMHVFSFRILKLFLSQFLHL